MTLRCWNPITLTTISNRFKFQIRSSSYSILSISLNPRSLQSQSRFSQSMLPSAIRDGDYNLFGFIHVKPPIVRFVDFKSRKQEAVSIQEGLKQHTCLRPLQSLFGRQFGGFSEQVPSDIHKSWKLEH